jgi:hypothetical protein
VHHFNSWFHEKTGSFKKAFYFLTLAANLSATRKQSFPSDGLSGAEELSSFACVPDMED